MKKWLGWIVLAVILVAGFTPYALKTDNFGWEVSDLSTKTNRGETTTAYTTPAVTERDYDNLIANHADAVVFTLDPFRYNVITCRFIVDDDGDDTVFDVFASKGQDYFIHAMTLTLKGSTVSGPDTSTNPGASVFCDTITPTITSGWWSTVTVVSGGADTQAQVSWDLQGFDTWALIGTTVDDTTLVQITGH